MATSSIRNLITASSSCSTNASNHWANSKSDYDIFTALAKRLGLSAAFTEAIRLRLVQAHLRGLRPRQPHHLEGVPEERLLRRPAEKEKLRAPTAYRWFYEGRKKDVPEPHPLPWRVPRSWLEGLQTQSGKLEFVPETLKKFDDPERPAVNRYIPSWEGTHSDRAVVQVSDSAANSTYPLQLSFAWRREGLDHQRHQATPDAGRRLLLPDLPHRSRRRREAGHQVGRSDSPFQRPRRSDLRRRGVKAVAHRGSTHL